MKTKSINLIQNTYKIRRSCISIMLTLAIIIGLMPINHSIASVITETSSGVTSTNVHKESYVYNWSLPMNSYLYENSDGTITRLEALSDNIVIETYTSDFKLKSTGTVSKELPLFGGFFSGTSYNYIIFGQNNYSEDDTVAVFEIVRYSKAWVKLGSDSLLGANTYIPFDAGSCRMCEYGGKLYVRTCHEMYMTSDGYHHQANVTIEYDEATDTIVDSYTGIMNVNYGYVSHSFNQFIKTNGSALVAVDHGDASITRGIMLQKYVQAAGSDSFSGRVNYIKLFSFNGNSGANYTGAQVGGFEVSSSSYLTAFSSIAQDDNYLTNNTDNVYISAVPSSDFSESAVVNKQITSYEEGGTYSASCPQLIKIHDSSFMLIWEVLKLSSNGGYSYDDSIQYVLLDASGQPTSGILSIAGSLSDCQPIVYKDKVTWYVTNNSTPVFYTLSTTGVAEPKPAVGSTATVNGISYNILSSSDSSKTVQITGVLGGMTSVTIPDTVIINGYSYHVSSIAPLAFVNNTAITSISIGSKVRNIGTKAFYGCTGITSLTIPATVTTIGDGIIDGCNGLTKVTNKASVAVSLPTLKKEGYSFLGWAASSYSNQYITSIAATTAYSRYNYIILIAAPTASKAPTTSKDPIASSTATVNGSKYKVNSDGKTLTYIAAVNRKSTKVTIPATVIINKTTYKVTKIKDEAFKNRTSLISVVIGANVNTIGKKAFYGCTKLKEVTFAGTAVKTFDSGAFQKCTSLKKITITKNVTKLGSDVFRQASKLKTIIIQSKKIKSVGSNAIKDIDKNATITVSSSKKKAYKKLFKGKYNWKIG